MTETPLRDQVNSLEQSLPSLRAWRGSNPFANDVYEAVVYWRDLGQFVLSGDTRIDFPARAREEKALLDRLIKLLCSRSSEEQERYAGVFDTAKGILNRVETTPASRNGHLGTVTIIKTVFDFLQTDYGFNIEDEQPLGVRYSSGKMYIDLRYSKQPSLSCSFGPKQQEGAVFWIDDLLFLYGDFRYRSMPESLKLDTEGDVGAWFQFVADVFKQHGYEVLTNQSGIFDRLARAQAERDKEYVAAMNEESGRP